MNGDPVSELKADEETESDCYMTANPQNKNEQKYIYNFAHFI